MNKANQLTILMYHSIGVLDNGEIDSELYSVLENNFKEQMEHLSPKVTTNNVKAIILTFDDGDITNYKYAYPILKDKGFTAYFFIIVSKVGAGGYMNWEQIRELRDSGMIIGSHGMTHRILTELSDKEIDYELRQSKKVLEDNLNHPINYFSIPRGFYNQIIIKKAKEIGYKAVFTSNPKDNDGFKFGRITIKRNWDLGYFIKVVNNGYPLKDKIEEMMKSSSKRILGTKRYDKFRSWILNK